MCVWGAGWGAGEDLTTEESGLEFKWDLTRVSMHFPAPCQLPLGKSCSCAHTPLQAGAMAGAQQEMLKKQNKTVKGLSV